MAHKAVGTIFFSIRLQGSLLGGSSEYVASLILQQILLLNADVPTQFIVLNFAKTLTFVCIRVFSMIIAFNGCTGPQICPFKITALLFSRCMVDFWLKYRAYVSAIADCNWTQTPSQSHQHGRLFCHRRTFGHFLFH